MSPPLLRRPLGPRHLCLMTPTAATPPTPIPANVKVVAPAAGCLFSSANVPHGRGSGGSCGS